MANIPASYYMHLRFESRRRDRLPAFTAAHVFPLSLEANSRTQGVLQNTSRRLSGLACYNLTTVLTLRQVRLGYTD